jgi:putative resolvase
MEHTSSPKQFGALIGKSVLTLQRWDKAGIFPAQRTPTNRRYSTQDQYLEYRGLKARGAGTTMVSARVSSASQKPDQWLEEVGSGLNDQRTPFNRVMEEIELGRVQRLIIAHTDRLVRCGFAWFAAFCERHGTGLVIVHGDTLSPEQELVQDVLSMVHIFSARLSGLRSYQKVIRDVAVQKNSPPGE